MASRARGGKNATHARTDNTEATTPAIQHATLPLDALTPHPRNYRRHPEQQLARLGASLARFGQVRSIVVQEGAPGRYLIVAGHGLVEAARQQSYTTLRADVIPATWTDAQVEGYLVADNQHAAGADDDVAALVALLQAQDAADYDLESLGTSRDELDALLESLAAAGDGDWAAALDGLPDGDKAPFQQMTFTLTDGQAALVRRALDGAKDDAAGVDDTGNANSNGNALAHLAASYLHGTAVEA